MSILKLEDLPVEQKRTFCRLDLNVPLTSDGKVADDTRIQAALPSVRHLLERGTRLICASHLGRPKGKPEKGLSLEPVAARLAELLEVEVHFTEDPVGDGPRKVVADLRDGELALLENLRFHPGETKNDPDLSRELAALCDVYVNDAFGTAHRAHASTAGMVEHVRYKGAGLLMFKEIAFFNKLLGAPERPFVAVLGGAKVSDKIGVLKNLISRVDVLMVGGAMANTFLAAQGVPMGKSMVETDKLKVAREILDGARARGVELLLPADVVVAQSPDAARGEVVSVQKVDETFMALDIGPETATRFGEKVAKAGTVFWNGPMGVFEKAPFAEGTIVVAREVAASRALSVVGGGDSVAAVNKAGVADRISHISTGGGASLEMMEGKKLPGIAVLEI